MSRARRRRRYRARRRARLVEGALRLQARQAMASWREYEAAIEARMPALHAARMARPGSAEALRVQRAPLERMAALQRRPSCPARPLIAGGAGRSVRGPLQHLTDATPGGPCPETRRRDGFAEP